MSERMRVAHYLHQLFAGMLAILLTLGIAQTALAAPLPPGTSDRVLLLLNGLANTDVLIPERPPGNLEPPVVIPCPNLDGHTPCLAGASVGLFESRGGLSDVLFVTASALTFESDAEGGPVLDPLPGMVFLPETGDLQDVSALLLSPAQIAAGFTLFVQSDLEPAPEPASAVLLALGMFGLWLAGRHRES